MPVNDLKSIDFLDNLRMKAKIEQDDEELKVIKLFASNYARYHCITCLKELHKMDGNNLRIASYETEQ